MKNPSPQPMSYKDFMQKLTQAEKTKQCKTSVQPTPRQQNRTSRIEVGNKNNKNYVKAASPHTQSTSLWDKSTSRKKKLTTESSADKHQLQTCSHNQSLFQNEVKQENLTKKDRLMCYHKFVSESMTILTKIVNTSATELLKHRISYI